MPVQLNSQPMIAVLLIAFPLVLSSCPSQTTHHVTIVGTDYAFDIPAPLPAGVTAFAFENRGQQRHEMGLVRLKPGITIDSVLAVERGPNRRVLLDVNTGGILFADPGQLSVDRLLVRLEVGRTYLVICNFRDAPDKPEHSVLGMAAGFTVQ
jgi:hypothetical protein